MESHRKPCGGAFSKKDGDVWQAVEGVCFLFAGRSPDDAMERKEGRAVRFDVAIWPVWSQHADGYRSLPIMAWVEATCAFAAVEQVMRSHGLRAAGHVAAAAQDHSLIYRGYGVKLVMHPYRGGSLHRQQGKETMT